MNEIPPFGDRYDFIEDIGSGAYGKVFKARERATNETVAVKAIDTSPAKGLLKNGFPVVTVREIKFIRELKHRNIVGLKAVVTDGKTLNVYLVFEYCEFDLQGLLATECRLDKKRVICYMRQILTGLYVCHSRRIYHRDLKPANILLTATNVVKIGDFGLAKRYIDNDPRPKTYNVITLWYRPLELLLQSTKYGMEVDIWSVGCIFYEMITGRPLFRGDVSGGELQQNMSQITTILSMCGNPDDTGWNEWRKLPQAGLVREWRESPQEKAMRGVPGRLENHLRETIPREFQELGAIDLMLKMLALNPHERISAPDALLHPFLRSPNDAYEPENLDRITCAEIHSRPPKEKGPGEIQIRRGAGHI